MLASLVRPIVFAALLLSAIPTSADWLCDFINSVARDTKRRNCWPNPFVCPDRQVTRMPLAIMVENGWRRQNMLGDFHFEKKTGKLTEAGQLKIRWIIYEAPAQHRSIFVHIGQTNEETDARLESTQEYVASLVPHDEMPPIMQTTISDSGSPADRVEMIDRKYQSSMPAPRLPAVTNQNSSSSSSSPQ
ncbi:MAG TPA: hypothetical protein VIH42_04285 [Thermoguttaceae bacterium]